MATRHFIACTVLGTVFSLILGSQTTQAETINWRTNLDAAKIEASQSNRLVLLHFWTKSCGPCKLLERNVFSQPQLGQALEKDYVPVKVDADMSPALASAYRIDRVPTDILLTPQGTVLARLSCPSTADAYAAQLAKAAQHFRQLAPPQNKPQQTPVQSAYAGLRIGQNIAPSATPQQPPQPQNKPEVVAAGQPVITENPYAARAPSAARQPAPQAAPSPQIKPTPNRYAAPVAPRPAATIPSNPVSKNYPVQQRQVGIAQTANTPPTVATPTSPAVQTVSAQTSRQPQVNIALPKQPEVSPVAQQAAVPPVIPQTNAASVPNQPKTPATLAPQLPVDAPPAAFDGFCAVTLKNDRIWLKGNMKYGAYHRGRTFLFAGREQQKLFLANPDAYSPVFSGMDVVKMIDENQKVEGSRKFGFEYRDAFYLFSNQQTMERFAANPDRYAAGVRQAMLRMDSNISGTIRR